MTRPKRVPQDADRDFAGPSGLPFGSPKQDSDGGLKTSLVQLVYETIMAALDAGELTPGSRIIASELATRLGLSRAPVREALAVLAGQGLVELLPDRGAMLRPMSVRDLAAIYEVSAPVAAIGLREGRAAHRLLGTTPRGSARRWPRSGRPATIRRRISVFSWCSTNSIIS